MLLSLHSNSLEGSTSPAAVASTVAGPQQQASRGASLAKAILSPAAFLSAAKVGEAASREGERASERGRRGGWGGDAGREAGPPDRDAAGLVQVRRARALFVSWSCLSGEGKRGGWGEVGREKEGRDVGGKRRELKILGNQVSPQRAAGAAAFSLHPPAGARSWLANTAQHFFPNHFFNAKSSTHYLPDGLGRALAYTKCASSEPVMRVSRYKFSQLFCEYEWFHSCIFTH